jgi:hypothetical protein
MRLDQRLIEDLVPAALYFLNGYLQTAQESSLLGKRRLNQSTLGVLTATRIAEPIPVGAIIEIRVEPAETDRMVDVVWAGEAYQMFVRDILDRGEDLLDEQPGDCKSLTASR